MNTKLSLCLLFCVLFVKTVYGQSYTIHTSLKSETWIEPYNGKENPIFGGFLTDKNHGFVNEHLTEDNATWIKNEKEINASLKWTNDDLGITIPETDKVVLNEYLATWDGNIMAIDKDHNITANTSTGGNPAEHIYDGEKVLIIIAGRLRFEQENDLRLPVGSEIIILSDGVLSSSKSGSEDSSSEIDLGDDTLLWDGKKDGDLEGLKIINKDGIELLPTQLISFTASQKASTIRLQWATASEINSKDFEVESSYDGLNFKNLGTVKAQGNSTSHINYEYTFIDHSLSKRYFRLKQNDLDHHFSYSKVVALIPSVEESDAVVLKVFPNPTADMVHIQTLGFEIKNIRLYSSDGKILPLSYQKIADDHVLTDLSKQRTGIYFLQIETNHTVLTEKMIRK